MCSIYTVNIQIAMSVCTYPYEHLYMQICALQMDLSCVETESRLVVVWGQWMGTGINLTGTKDLIGIMKMF